MTQEIITFGCRLNSYESEVIRQNIKASGLENIAVFNTCAVTKEAERQAKQSIRKFKREHPEHHVIVTGCAAQIHPKAFDLPEVDKILGNEEKLDASSYQSDLFKPETEKIVVNDIMSVTETASHLVSGFEGRARAYLQIQNGCNHRCTFCIIPYGRGNSRSVSIGDIVSQTTLLVEQGYKEVVLTGVDISDYGKDLPGTPTLGEMIKRLLHLIPDLPRLRLSSIDVAEIDDDLLEVIATNKRLMPHLHLSLQSGDNMILKRMKRRHTREDVIAFCNKVRALRPDMVFGADIITGFPTETDAMFQNTLDIVKEAGLTHLHVFPYSEREGTPAAAIPQEKQVPVATRKARAQQLRSLGEEKLQTLLSTQVGKTLSVIVEQGNKARTETFTLAEFSGEAKVGELITLHATDIHNGHLLGALCS